MKESDKIAMRNKLIGLGKNSMRKTYYSELLAEKQKLEEQNRQLVEEIQQRVDAEMRLQALNEVLEERIFERTEELEAMNTTLEQSLTDLRQAQSYIVQTEKLAALGGLVAGISHEVNTPLGVCITSITYFQKLVEALRKDYHLGTLNSAQLEEFCMESEAIAELLFTNLNRSAGTLENLKQVAIDQSHYEYRWFAIREYTLKILSNLNSELRKNNVSIQLNCEEHMSIQGYPGILTQILTNLIMNSLIHGFTQKQGGEIVLDFYFEEGNIVLRYRDNGVGMDPVSVDKAFEPFFTTKRGMGSGGLGLFVVFNLVTARLHGTMTLKSRLNEGVEFIIRVPIEHRMSDELEAMMGIR